MIVKLVHECWISPSRGRPLGYQTHICSMYVCMFSIALSFYYISRFILSYSFPSGYQQPNVGTPTAQSCQVPQAPSDVRAQGNSRGSQTSKHTNRHKAMTSSNNINMFGRNMKATSMNNIINNINNIHTYKQANYKNTAKHKQQQSTRRGDRSSKCPDFARLCSRKCAWGVV